MRDNRIYLPITIPYRNRRLNKLSLKWNKEVNIMHLGKQIKNIRKTKNISQQELSSRVKYLNQSQIAKIENGNRKITAIDLINIAKALEVSENKLLMGKGGTK